MAFGNGIKFGDYHTAADWMLFLADVEISPPEVQTYTVEVPGRDGYLDLTDVITEDVRYYNRTLEATFDVAIVDRSTTWADIVSEIYSRIHGQKLKIILDDDPDWYYYGRVSVDGDSSSGEITITADCEPYKYAVSETVYEISKSCTAALVNGRMKVTPTVTVTNETMITTSESSISLSAGSYDMTDFALSEGVTEWEIETSGTVTIAYRQGRL